jgi:hypothetical protein
MKGETMTTLRAHVHIADVTIEQARTVREAVDAWAATRPHLERPAVVWTRTPDDVHGWATPDDRVTVELVDPLPDDLLELADVLRPYGDPRLNMTRDHPRGETMSA